MAEIAAVSEDKQKKCRRANKTTRQLRVFVAKQSTIVKQVAAVNALLAAFREGRKCYKADTLNTKSNDTTTWKVTWKSIRDRYKRTQDQFDKEEDAN